MLGEKVSWNVTLTVWTMVGGSLIAAADDLSFDLVGYVFVLVNDVFTAANGKCGVLRASVWCTEGFKGGRPFLRPSGICLRPRQ